MLAVGRRVAPIATGRAGEIFEIKAVHRTPVHYVELEPLGGGVRNPILVAELHRGYRLLRDARAGHPAADH